MSRKALTFIGISNAESKPEAVEEGRRRIVTVLSFIIFVLLAAAAADNEWVVGELQFTVTSYAEWRATAENTGGLCPSPPTHLAAKDPLRATVVSQFKLGLSRATESLAFTYPYSDAPGERDCSYDLDPYIGNINAATLVPYNGTGRPNLWYGLEPISLGTFHATEGLLGFAAAMQLLVWIVMVLYQYGTPFVVEKKLTLPIVRWMTIPILLFTVIPIAVFGASPVRSEFCKAFSEETAYGVGCGYSSGFDIAIAAMVMGFLNMLLAWFYMPLSSAYKYAYSASAEAATAPAFANLTEHAPSSYQ